MLHNEVRRQQLIEQMGWSSTRVHSIRAVIMEPAAVYISDISHPWLIMSAFYWLIIHTTCIKRGAVIISVILCGCEESSVSWGGTDLWSVELNDKDLIHTVQLETADHFCVALGEIWFSQTWTRGLTPQRSTRRTGRDFTRTRRVFKVFNGQKLMQTAWYVSLYSLWLLFAVKGRFWLTCLWCSNATLFLIARSSRKNAHSEFGGVVLHRIGWVDSFNRI